MLARRAAAESCEVRILWQTPSLSCGHTALVTLFLRARGGGHSPYCRFMESFGLKFVGNGVKSMGYARESRTRTAWREKETKSGSTMAEPFRRPAVGLASSLAPFRLIHRAQEHHHHNHPMTASDYDCFLRSKWDCFTSWLRPCVSWHCALQLLLCCCRSLR
jgi:hypothetical protein